MTKRSELRRTPFKPRTTRIKRTPWRGDGQRAPRTPLGRSEQPIPRTTTLKARGKKGSRFPHRRIPGYCGEVAQLPCVLAWTGECAEVVDPDHVKTRNSSGDDLYNVVPLCHTHHEEKHRGLQTFQRKYGVNLRVIARLIGDRLAERFARVAGPTHEEMGG